MNDPVQVCATCDVRGDVHDFKKSRLLVEFMSEQAEAVGDPPCSLKYIEVCAKCGALRLPPSVIAKVLR